jgi:rhodanese-related sulfurtransferase
MPTVTATEIASRINNFGPDEIIVDVRENDEFLDTHIEKSINLPLSNIGKNIQTLKNYEKIYLLCETGGRSSYAHEVLKTAEINTIDIIGGIAALKRAGVEVIEAA